MDNSIVVVDSSIVVVDSSIVVADSIVYNSIAFVANTVAGDNIVGNSIEADNIVFFVRDNSEHSESISSRTLSFSLSWYNRNSRARMDYNIP